MLSKATTNAVNFECVPDPVTSLNVGAGSVWSETTTVVYTGAYL